MYAACPLAGRHKRAVRAFVLAFLAALALGARGENWPGWRGPRGDGTCLETNTPTDWAASNSVWKVAIPGRGHASPVVWDERLFIVTAEPATRERILLCLDRSDGHTLWRQTVVEGPLEALHKENSYGSSTPATDGERVYVTFRVGSNIVVAAHAVADGRQLWRVTPGTHAGEWGFNNEPVLYRDKVIVDGDGKGDSFLVALNRGNGQESWRLARSHKGISYSAPFIRELAGRVQLIQCGDRRITSFDPDTGAENWVVVGPSEEFVATPVYSAKAGLIFASSSWPKRVLMAIRPDGKGDVTQTHVVWRDEKGAPYVPSMMVCGDYLLSVNHTGVAFCYEAATGTVLWQERIGSHRASSVLIEGIVYWINEGGEVNAIRPGPKFERVARYELGESCYASPAISDGQVFIRGFEHLWCVGARVKR